MREGIVKKAWTVQVSGLGVARENGGDGDARGDYVEHALTQTARSSTLSFNRNTWFPSTV